MGFGSETGAEIGAGSFSVVEVGHPDPPRSLGTPAERENRKTHQRSRGGCLRGICPAQNRLSQNSGKRPSMGAAQVPGPRDRSHRRWGRSICGLIAGGGVRGGNIAKRTSGPGAMASGFARLSSISVKWAECDRRVARLRHRVHASDLRLLKLEDSNLVGLPAGAPELRISSKWSAVPKMGETVE